MMDIVILEKEEKMLTNNGYSLVYDKRHNVIVIRLPQTWRTLASTYEPIVDRKIDVEDKDLAILLNATQAIFLNEEGKEDETN